MYCKASESRLYTFSQESKEHLRKFRLGTSRSNDPQAVICMYVFPGGGGEGGRPHESPSSPLTGSRARHDRQEHA